MSSETSKVIEKLVKTAAKHAVKLGLLKTELPAHVVSGLADQLAVAYDLIRESGASGTLKPAKLAQILAQKGIGIGKMGSASRRWQCGIAIAVLSVSLWKATGALIEALGTEGLLTPVFLVEASFALSDAYSMDKVCGISEGIMEEIEDVVDPVYMWLENGIKSLYGVSY
jgi:hypothetical protein